MNDLEINDNYGALNLDADDDDPFAIPPPLPGSFLEEDPADIAVEENGDVINPQDNVAVGDLPQESGEKKKKKRAFKPRVNLNEERLCSKKGIEALKKLCSDVDFKGRGHEVSDLNKLLHRFEHWAQCLMPRWPFDNVVQKCELLGSKSRCRNELKRVRTSEEEILRGEPEDGDKDTGQDETDSAVDERNPAEESTQQDVPLGENGLQTKLTAEQLERIRRNRELAFARREANKRRKLAEQSQTESHLDNQADPEPTIHVINSFEQPSITELNSVNEEEMETINNENGNQNKSHESSYESTPENEESHDNEALENEGSNSSELLNVISEREDKIGDISDSDDDMLNRSAFELNTASQDSPFIASDTNNTLNTTDVDGEELQNHSNNVAVSVDNAGTVMNDEGGSSLTSLEPNES